MFNNDNKQILDFIKYNTYSMFPHLKKKNNLKCFYISKSLDIFYSLYDCQSSDLWI